MTNFERRFSVGQSGSAEHNRIFGPPPPGTLRARLEGCICDPESPARPVHEDCPLHGHPKESVE